jgi:hypothetical protein
MSDFDRDQTRWTRTGWRRHRKGLLMTDPPSGEDFASGGLAAQAAPLDVRVVVLPADVESADRVALDADTAEWIAQDRPAPYGGRSIQWGHSTCATSSALVRAAWNGDDQEWNRYLGIHRHGGLEAGITGLSWQANGQRGFALRRTVASVWIVAQLQIEAAEKWSIEGPWELSLAMRNTADATLGDFAEGWAQFGDFRHGGSVCREAHVFHRWAIESIHPPSLALDAGARLENSFGTTHRRHLAYRGEYEGEFDPRFVW